MTNSIVQPVPEKKRRSRWVLWLLSVIAAFILGYLLHKCPCVSPISSGDGSPSYGAGPAPGAPGGGKHGGGGGSGAGGDLAGSPSPDSVAGSGHPLQGSDDGDQNGAGGGSGGTPDSDQGTGSANMPDVSGFGNYVANLAGGDGVAPKPDDVTPPDYKTVQKSARDFSLDHTGLPRYPTQTRVMSGTATRVDVPGDSSTAAVFETSDSFEKVADWYHTQIPAGWKETRMDDMQKAAQSVSRDNIQKAFMAYATGTPATPDSAPASAAGPSVALWEAPPDGSPVRRSVMVSTMPGKPTVVFLSEGAHQ